MNKENKEKVVITSIETKENNLLEVIDSDGRKEFFPVYAFELLLDIMQHFEDVSRMMEYANLLNKHLLFENKELILVDGNIRNKD